MCPLETACPEEEVDEGEAILLGLAMPTHGFTAPWSMLRFALRLPCRRGTHALAVATRAGLKIGSVYTPGIEGTGTAILALILALKGYRVRGAVGVDMPSNWLAVHPGLSPHAVAGIVGRAEEQVADLMEHILSGGRRFRGWIPLLIGLYLFQISLGYLLVGRLGSLPVECCWPTVAGSDPTCAALLAADSHIRRMGRDLPTP